MDLTWLKAVPMVVVVVVVLVSVLVVAAAAVAWYEQKKKKCKGSHEKLRNQHRNRSVVGAVLGSVAFPSESTRGRGPHPIRHPGTLFGAWVLGLGDQFRLGRFQ